MSEAIRDEVAEGIHRCAVVAGDLVALRDATHELRLSSDPRAQLAAALFDLDRARRGDAEARRTMAQVADALLLFWRDGTGETLAAGHPELVRLWDATRALLATFDAQRLAQALRSCWDARGDVDALTAAVAAIPSSTRRMDFARCLYHLELARLAVAASRAEFSARAGLLAEAYQDPAVAKELIGDDEGLAELWRDLVPYLDEFFEHQERKAFLARSTQVTAPSLPQVQARDRDKTDPGRPVPLGSEERAVPSFRTLLRKHNEAPAPTPPGPPSFSSQGSGLSSVPPPRTTAPFESQDSGLSTAPTPPPFAAPEAAEEAPAADESASPVAPPSPPRGRAPFGERPARDSAESPFAPHTEDLSPAPSPPPVPRGDEAPRARSPFGERPAAPAPPRASPFARHAGDLSPAPTPPPVPSTGDASAFARSAGAPGDTLQDTPPLSAHVNDLLAAFEAPPELVDELFTPPPALPPSAQPPLGEVPPPRTPTGELEVVEEEALIEAEPEQPPLPPRPPALTPSEGLPALDIELAELEPEFEPDAPTLDFWAHTFDVLQMAGGAEGRTSQRLFATETRADRKRLVDYLDTLPSHLAVPEARAFACLTRLLLAVQTKEKGLFGQANPVRQDAVTAALGLLTSPPDAAGRAAVWFELDGPDTREQLAKGLEVLTQYLAWCARENVDPLSTAAPRRFALSG